MPKHQQFENLKEFLATGRGRVSVVAVIALVLILAAVAPSWLPHKASNKERAVAQSVTDLARADNKSLTGTVTLKFGGVNATVNVDLAAKNLHQMQGNLKANVAIGASTYDIPLQYVYDKDKKVQYYKVDNVQPLIDAALNPEAPATVKIQNVINKISGKWLKIASGDINPQAIASQVSSNVAPAQVDQCTPQLLDRLQHDSSASESLATILASRTLFTIDKTSSVQGGHEYSITINPDKAKDALKVLKKTELFKGASKCDQSYGEADQTTAANGQATQSAPSQKAESIDALKLTINDKKQITQISYGSTSATQSLSLNLTVGSDKPVAVTIPTDNVISYDTVSGDVNSIFKLLTTAPSGQTDGTPSNLVQPYAGS